MVSPTKIQVFINNLNNSNTKYEENDKKNLESFKIDKNQRSN